MDQSYSVFVRSIWYAFWDEIRRNEADAVLGAPKRELPGRVVVELPRDGKKTTASVLGPAPPGHVPCADAPEGAAGQNGDQDLTTNI